MSNLRILGGTAKGRLLNVPDTARPTTVRIRKSLMDILEARYETGQSLVDLYAGAGSVGLEAASRGFQVTMVERDAQAVKILQHNTKALSLMATTIRTDASTFLSTSKNVFDIIFIDPPYDQNIAQITQQALKHANRISPAGVLIIQSPKQLSLSASITEFRPERRVYGSNVLTFFWRVEA